MGHLHSIVELTTKVSPPGIEPGLRPSQGRVRIRHTPRTLLFVQHPAEESNPVWQIRSLPCRPSHSQGMSVSIPTRNRTWSWTLRRLPCYPLHHRDHVVSIPTWSRTRTKTLGGSCAVRYTIGTSRADDWICTSIIRFTKPAPFAIRPRRHKCASRPEGREPWLSSTSPARRSSTPR